MSANMSFGNFNVNLTASFGFTSNGLTSTVMSGFSAAGSVGGAQIMSFASSFQSGGFSASMSIWAGGGGCYQPAPLPAPRPELAGPAAGKRSAALSARARRHVFFESADGFVDCAVYARGDLRPDDVLRGPAIVEQMDTTTVLPPDFTARVDAIGNLRLARTSAQRYEQ